MRVAVTEQGLASATEAFVSGNELAARAAIALTDRLGGCAGMAGDDATAQAFAAAYDETAAACCATLEDLVGALASLARLTEASLANHHRADVRATLPGWARPAVGPPTVADRAVGVRLPAPASSLGATEDPPGGLAGVVLDLLHEVWWPNADTDRVRSAARAWHAAAESVGLVVAHCGSAAGALGGERSPEVPLALAATGALRARADELAAHLGALADSCDAYADQVEAHRHLLLDLLEELVKELAIGGIVSGGLTVLSGGAAGALAGAAGAARLAAASARVRAVLERLRVLASGTALTLRPVAVGVGDAGRALRPMRDARVVLMEGRAGGAAAERASSASRLVGDLRPGWLAEHEGVGAGTGHTLAKHVGQSVEELRARFDKQRWLRESSTFRSEADAERFIGLTLERNAHEIASWLPTAEHSEAFVAQFGEVHVGDVLIRRSGELARGNGVKAVLKPDPTMPRGWRLITAHPISGGG